MTTNYEKIKNMTVDEMAKFLRNCDDCYQLCVGAPICHNTNRTQYCEMFIKQWLEQECE